MRTVEPDPVALRDALNRGSTRIVRALRGSSHLDHPVPGLEWRSGQVAGHLALVYRAFAGALRGEHLGDDLAGAIGEGSTMREVVTATNARTLELTADSFADPGEAADELSSRAGELLSALAELKPDLAATRPTPWYGSAVALQVGTLAALAVSETLVHGYDLDRALGLPRPRLDPVAAAAAAPTVMSSMLPLLVDRDGVGSRSYGFELRVRGGRPFALRIADGRAWPEPAGEGSVDCVISLTGEAALLTGFARQPLWRSVASGAAVAFGRKPWLGLRFNRLFLTV